MIDFSQSTTRPIFFSASLFPIYKYDPKISNVREHYAPTVAWIIGLFVALIWAFCSSYVVIPAWFGVIVCIGVELLMLISGIYMISITREALS